MLSSPSSLRTRGRERSLIQRKVIHFSSLSYKGPTLQISESHSTESPDQAGSNSHSRKSKRAIKKRVRYIEAYLVKAMASTDSAVQEPMTYNEAKQGQELIQWMQAVKEEMDALFKAGTYELVDLPPTTRTQGPWSEMGLQAQIPKFFGWVGGTTFDTYAPVLHYESLPVYSWDLQYYWILTSIKWI